jgi:hypothetical protein
MSNQRITAEAQDTRFAKTSGPCEIANAVRKSPVRRCYLGAASDANSHSRYGPLPCSTGITRNSGTR